MAEHKMIGKEKEVIIERDTKKPKKEAKFMVLKVQDEGRKDGTKDMIVSLPLSTHPWHKDVLSTCINKFWDKEGKVICGEDGGGYITVDDKKKTIKAYSSSGDFGPADRVLVEKILKRNFPSHRILIDIPNRIRKTPDEAAKIVLNQAEKSFQELVERVGWTIEDLPEEAASYMKVFRDQLMRLKRAMDGKTQNGAVILASSHSKSVEALLKRHPGLEDDVKGGRISNIAEVYDTDLIRETLKVMAEIEGERFAKEAAHILGEMALIKNSPGIYTRMLAVLKKNAKNEKMLSKILYDDRLEFHKDPVIDEALKDYEK